MDGKIYTKIEPLAKTASWLFNFSLSLQKDLFSMITGEIRTKIDAIKQKAAATMFGVNLDNPASPEESWTNPRTGNPVPYKNLRWSRFKGLSDGRI